MHLTREGSEELLRRLSDRILDSSQIAYICAEYTDHNNFPVTPTLIAEYILTCSLRQGDDGEYEIVAPNGENIRFMILCARPITEILNSEMEDTIREVRFKYRVSIDPHLPMGDERVSI